MTIEERIQEAVKEHLRDFMKWSGEHWQTIPEEHGEVTDLPNDPKEAWAFGWNSCAESLITAYDLYMEFDPEYGG